MLSSLSKSFVGLLTFCCFVFKPFLQPNKCALCWLEFVLVNPSSIEGDSDKSEYHCHAHQDGYDDHQYDAEDRVLDVVDGTQRETQDTSMEDL